MNNYPEFMERYDILKNNLTNSYDIYTYYHKKKQIKKYKKI